ncbi:hypothetical protein KM043_014066 [Ampulex compressa]|nr:hypothetical protein KM043_014066 [Ampulex compressa]
MRGRNEPTAGKLKGKYKLCEKSALVRRVREEGKMKKEIGEKKEKRKAEGKYKLYEKSALAKTCKYRGKMGKGHKKKNLKANRNYAKSLRWRSLRATGKSEAKKKRVQRQRATGKYKLREKRPFANSCTEKEGGKEFFRARAKAK